MNMYEYNKMMLNRIEQTHLEPAFEYDDLYFPCAVCGCAEKVNEMHEIHRENAQYAYVCYDCIDNYCNVDDALRFLPANDLERDYFVRVYMNTECSDSADDRIVDACKEAWLKQYSTCTAGDYSYEAETLLDYVLKSELWNDWVAAELLS